MKIQKRKARILKQRIRYWNKLQWESVSSVQELDGPGIGYIHGMSFYTCVTLGTRAAKAEHKRRMGW